MALIRNYILPNIVGLVSQIRQDAYIVVRFTPTQTMPLGLSIHRGRCDSMIRRVMRGSSADKIVKDREAIFCAERTNAAQALCDVMIAGLVEICRQPISLRHVERVLRITPKERAKWTKAGRLFVSGTSTILRGSTRVSLPTYATVEIEYLSQKPEVIAKWREADAAEKELADRHA